MQPQVEKSLGAEAGAGADCYHWQLQPLGNVEPPLPGATNASTAKACQAACKAQCACNFFAWSGDTKGCSLYHSLPSNKTAPATSAMGPAICDDPTKPTPPLFLPGGHACVPQHTRCVDVDTMPFCNASLPIPDRVKDLLGRLTLQEKQDLTVITGGGSDLQPGDGGVPRLGIPNYNWGLENLHGIQSQCFGQRCPTIMPILAAAASSFDRSVWSAMGRVIGTELRAANNARALRGNAQANIVGLNGWGKPP